MSMLPKSTLTLALAMAVAIPGTQPPAAVQVLVLEEGTETPIRGAELWLSAPGVEPRSATTGADGTAWLRDLRPGSYRLQVSSRIHRSYRERRHDDATVSPRPDPRAAVSIHEPGSADL